MTTEGLIKSGPVGSGTMHRVLLVSNNRFVRAGIRAILEPHDDMSVVAEGSWESNVPGLIRSSRPDVVVSGPSPAGQGEATDPGSLALPVIVLCESLDDRVLDAAIRSGARGIVLTDGDSGQVVNAVREVVAGNSFLVPSVTGYLLDQLARHLPRTNHPAADRIRLLTEREREVLLLMASGLTTAQVGQKMRLRPTTVKTHIAHILTKLDLDGRTQAIALAYQTGLVTNDAAQLAVTDVVQESGRMRPGPGPGRAANRC